MKPVYLHVAFTAVITMTSFFLGYLYKEYESHGTAVLSINGTAASVSDSASPWRNTAGNTVMDTTGKAPDKHMAMDTDRRRNGNHTNDFTVYNIGVSGTDSIVTWKNLTASGDHANDRLVYNRLPKCGSTSATRIIRTLTIRNNFTLVVSDVYDQTEVASQMEQVGGSSSSSSSNSISSSST